MAKVIHVRKLYDKLVPADMAQMELLEELKPNGEYKATFTTARNGKFFRKWWALVTYAFKNWDGPEVEHKGERIQKNLERFRKDMIIQSGHYTVTADIDGRVRLEADSISFDSMEEDDFEKLYSATIDVILSKILRSYTRDDLDHVVEQILRFA